MARPHYQDDLPHLRTEEEVGPGLRRVVRECCARARQGRARIPTDEAVHEARRALKRARAALRLEEKLGRNGARALRKRLSAAARELSPRRDAAVAVHVAQRLASKLGGLTARESMLAPKCIPTRGDAAWWQAWQRRLAAEENKLRRRDAGRPKPDDVRRVLHHFAKRVCKCAKEAAAKGDIVSAHEWRKAVIVLREQLLVARALLSDDEAGVCGELHKLAQRLGKATDYNVLKQSLESGDAPRGPRRRVDCAVTERRGRAMRRARRKWPKVRRVLRKRL